MDYTKYPGGAVIYMDIPLMYKTRSRHCLQV